VRGESWQQGTLQDRPQVAGAEGLVPPPGLLERLVATQVAAGGPPVNPLEE
jgi:hypothetical protein